MRFVLERSWLDTWTCHEEAAPDAATGDRDAEVALRRACDLYGVEKASLALVEVGKDRIVFSRPAPCPDCGGTGRYVGLTVVEVCRTCGGAGEG